MLSLRKSSTFFGPRRASATCFSFDLTFITLAFQWSCRSTDKLSLGKLGVSGAAICAFRLWTWSFQPPG